MTARKPKPKLPTTKPEPVTTAVALPSGPYIERVQQAGAVAPGGAQRVDVLPAGRDLIVALAKDGAPQSHIAASLGIALRTFRDVMTRDEDVRLAWERGRGELEYEVATMLLKAARGGHVIAAIYYSKAQLGWRENEPPTDNRVAVSIVLPDAFTPEQYMRTINAPVKITRPVHPPVLPGPTTDDEPSAPTMKETMR